MKTKTRPNQMTRISIDEFTVTRQIFVNRCDEPESHKMEIVRIPILAESGAHASKLADEHKFKVEQLLGHHSRKGKDGGYVPCWD